MTHPDEGDGDNYKQRAVVEFGNERKKSFSYLTVNVDEDNFGRTSAACTPKSSASSPALSPSASTAALDAPRLSSALTCSDSYRPSQAPTLTRTNSRTNSSSIVATLNRKLAADVVNVEETLFGEELDLVDEVNRAAKVSSEKEDLVVQHFVDEAFRSYDQV
jgi:hypothetical protein